MADTATLTIRLDEQLKQRLERMAAAEDRSVSEYVVRAIKERLDVQCGACGRSSGTSVLPIALTQPFETLLKEARENRNPFFITTVEAGQKVVYWGFYRSSNLSQAGTGSVPMNLYLQEQASDRTFATSIPFGVITGWGWDHMEGTEYHHLCDLGYVDGNESARRMARRER